MRNSRYSSGRAVIRSGNGRFAKATFKNVFGIEANTQPLICGNCGYGKKGEFIPLLSTGYCPICGNQEGHTPLNVIKSGSDDDGRG